METGTTKSCRPRKPNSEAGAATRHFERARCLASRGAQAKWVYPIRRHRSSQPVPGTFMETGQQRIVAEYVAQAPPLDRQALCNTVWNTGLESLREVIAEGRKFAASCAQTRGKIDKTVWDKDFTQSRTHIATH